MIIRGPIAFLRGDPFLHPTDDVFVQIDDGAILCLGGLIVRVGDYADVARHARADTPVHHYPGKIITPGFIDLHTHYVQSGMVGAHGRSLLDWLSDYTFVEEQKFSDRAYCAESAAFFCRELLRNGTTTAMVFAAVYPESADELFAEAERLGMRLIVGKVMMDRNAPEALLDTAQSAYDQSKALIERWHGRDRLLYAITPRFAPTSTAQQLEAAGDLWRAHPDVYVQTHLSENQDEVSWVSALFPEARSYLDVYDRHGLVGPRAVFAHGVHLAEEELGRLHESGAAIAHCPSSNLFLGSGLFRMEAATTAHRPVHLGLGSDIGGGTSFSLLRTAGEAYKVGRLTGRGLTAAQGLYLMTLGPARALGLDGVLGSLAPGYEADIVVLDPEATPLLHFRNARSKSIAETLFVLMTVADDRAVAAAYLGGRLTHARAERQDAGAAHQALPQA